MTTHETIAAFIAARAPLKPEMYAVPIYRLLPVPGTELCDEVRRGCPECGTAHGIQSCPAIRARLFAEEQ